MKTTYSPIATALLLSLFGMGSAQAQSKVETSDDMERIEVTGIAIKKSKGPTGLNLSEKDTPQAISIIDSATIENFQLETIEEVLSNTTGVFTAQDNCCKGSNLYARGFYLNSFVKDGIASAYGIFQ